MVNYYQTLKVSPNASRAEIRSAYRRLARELHPDVNSSTDTSQEFSMVAEAYQVLSDRKTREKYDRHLAAIIEGSDSFFDSDNAHARRLRRMAYERRFNEIVDQMLDADRRESRDLQKFVFPLVALFVSTMFVAIFRPMIWSNSAVLGKIILLTLFVAGMIQLLNRLKSGFQKFTGDELRPDSILDEPMDESKPYSRLKAVSLIVGGLCASVLIGYFIGNFLEMFIAAMIPNLFSPILLPEMAFYPPIIVLIVDTMHKIASKLDF